MRLCWRTQLLNHLQVPRVHGDTEGLGQGLSKGPLVFWAYQQEFGVLASPASTGGLVGAVLLFVSSHACSELKTLGLLEPKHSRLVSSNWEMLLGIHPFTSSQQHAGLLPLCSPPCSNRAACGCFWGLGCAGRRWLNQGPQPCPQVAQPHVQPPALNLEGRGAPLGLWG